tara:strand:- start:62 stop:676 length:615 start_codon:yes stop_codon:yes gene_type:complete
MEVDVASQFSIKDFGKELKGVDKEAFPLALNRTVNEVGAKAKTQAMRAMRKKMGIKRKRLTKRYFEIKRSTLRGTDFEYSWQGTSKPFPLSYFGGRGLKHRSKKGKFGYSAASLGTRRKYKFFEVKLASGHVGAFVRKSGARHTTSNTGKRGSYPIRQAYGASIPLGMIQDETEKAWTVASSQRIIDAKFGKNFAFYLSKVRRK